MAKPGGKRNSQRKDGGKTEHRTVHAAWLQDILGEALHLIMTTRDTRKLRKVLNDSSWKVKKAVMADALEQGNLTKANAIATYILNLTEVRKAAVEKNINVNENVRVLMDEIIDADFEILEKRASQLREAKRLRAGADRAGDDASGTGEVLLVEDASVQK